jgi:hypothetical protein
VRSERLAKDDDLGLALAAFYDERRRCGGLSGASPRHPSIH